MTVRREPAIFRYRKSGNTIRWSIMGKITEGISSLHAHIPQFAFAIFVKPLVEQITKVELIYNSTI